MAVGGAALLDVSVLIALVDPDHADHDRAHAWFERREAERWATCPITVNGLVRVIAQPAYPGARSLRDAIELARRLCGTPDHVSWPCNVSLIDPRHVDPAELKGHRQVTDAYLLALAVAQGGCLVTFDRSLARSAVPSAGEEHLIVL